MAIILIALHPEHNVIINDDTYQEVLYALSTDEPPTTPIT